MKRRRRPPRRRRISNSLLRNTLPNFSSRQIHHTGRRDFVGIGEDIFAKRRVFSTNSTTGCTRRIRLSRATFHTVIKKTSNATQKEDDLAAVVAKHTSKHATVAAKFVKLDGELSTRQSRLGALSKYQSQMDNTRALQWEILRHGQSRPRACSSVGVDWAAWRRRTSTQMSIGLDVSGHHWQSATWDGQRR